MNKLVKEAMKQKKRDKVAATLRHALMTSHPHTFQTGADEGGREVIVVVHQADVSGGEADCQQWFQALHWEETKDNTNTVNRQRDSDTMRCETV